MANQGSCQTTTTVQFVHVCPRCARRMLIAMTRLGRSIVCFGCGRTSEAADPDLESAAMLDSMKHHAELMHRQCWETEESGARLPR